MPSESGIQRQIILHFVWSLCLCDHMGDVADALDEFLQQLGYDDVPRYDDLHELTGWLEQYGITEGIFARAR